MPGVQELNQQIGDLQKLKQDIIDRQAEQHREEFESLKWLNGMKCYFRIGLNAYMGIEYSLGLWEEPAILKHVRDTTWSRGVTLAGTSRNYLDNVLLRLTFAQNGAPEIYSSNPEALAQFIRDHHLVIAHSNKPQEHLNLWKTVVEHTANI